MAALFLLQTTRDFARSLCAHTFQFHSLLQHRGFKRMSSAKKAKTDDTSPNNGDQKEERLVWVDLEMTGLDVEKDRIIEIACIVTSGNLKVIAEGPNIVINQSKELMDSMNDWCQEHHGKSGLTKSVLESQISTSEAEEKVLAFVRQHTDAGCAPLAGNSVHMDKMFLQRYMPSLTSHLHYRIVDVSTVKELCRRWYPTEFNSKPKKELAHRALDDIRESIKELQYYRQAIFKLSDSSTS
ncbi:putative oligoribonuclease [Babylonia areolata]|uniref:putative oligoribonuclease n=1 Tax=Babylonia areolata TaxID=304850 RepID=UPI003FD3B355